MIVVIPATLFTFVLVPRYRFQLAALPSHREAPRTFTLSWFEGRSGAEIVAEARSADWMEELGFEIEKLRELRNEKRRRFMLAITVSSATLLTVLLRLALA